MTPETHEILKNIAHKLWNVILDDTRAMSPGFSRPKRDTINGSAEGIIPSAEKDNWLRALNAMSEHEVFRHTIYENLDELGEYINNDLIYSIYDINPKRFIEFCKSCDINLYDRPDIHTAKLAITAENIPVIRVDDKTRYELLPLHDSTFVRILKIAFQPSLRGITLSIEQLNKEGSDKGTITRILGGKVFKIGSNIKRLKKYRHEIKIPELLDKFYTLTDGSITSTQSITIDDKTLNEIEEMAEYKTQIERKRG